MLSKESKPSNWYKENLCDEAMCYHRRSPLAEGYMQFLCREDVNRVTDREWLDFWEEKWNTEELKSSSKLEILELARVKLYDSFFVNVCDIYTIISASMVQYKDTPINIENIYKEMPESYIDNIVQKGDYAIDFAGILARIVWDYQLAERLLSKLMPVIISYETVSEIIHPCWYVNVLLLQHFIEKGRILANSVKCLENHIVEWNIKKEPDLLRLIFNNWLGEYTAWYKNNPPG